MTGCCVGFVKGWFRFGANFLFLVVKFRVNLNYFLLFQIYSETKVASQQLRSCPAMPRGNCVMLLAGNVADQVTLIDRKVKILNRNTSNWVKRL